ncbi:MAG TPA: shikimate kinase [Sandaracinaceae bacterium]
MRLCLVGMSGVGKSFWAKRLAERGWVRHDCDGAIGARLASLAPVAPGEEPVHALGRWMGMPWSEGYAEREARYLALEEEVTREALAHSRDGHVIDATGSVIYLSESLRSELRASCRVVYLRTPHERREAMLRRYLEEPKPVVWAGAFVARPNERPQDALPRCYAELLAIRDARYRSMAHVTLDGAALEANDPGIDGFLALVR